MKHDQLEEWIINHKNHLDEPFEQKDKVWANLEQHLSQQKPKTQWIKQLTGMAAAIALGLIAVWAYTQYHNQFLFSEELTASIEYYKDTESQLIRTISKNTDKLSEEIKRDLNEIHQAQQSLIEKLPYAPIDKKEWIINALIESYQLKIQILEELLQSDQLEKSYHHESNNTL